MSCLAYVHPQRSVPTADTLNDFLSGNLDILFTTTTRPLIHAATQHTFALFPFDAIPRHDQLVADMKALQPNDPALSEEALSSTGATMDTDNVWGTWSLSPAGISTQLHLVQFSADGEDFQCCGLLVPQIIALPDPFKVYTPAHGELVVSLRHVRQLVLNEEQGASIARLNHWIVTMLSGIDVNGDTRNLVLHPPSFRVFLQRYFVPITHGGDIEWEIVSLLESRGKSFSRAPLWPRNDDFASLRVGTVVLAEFNHRLYRYNRTLSDTLQQVPIVLKGKPATLVDYYREKWNCQELHPAQPLLELFELQLRMRNVLTPRPKETVDGDEPTKTSHPVPPQLCHVQLLPTSFFDALSWMPCVCHRMENWIRADSVRQRLGLRSTSLVLEALTAPSTHEDFNYELSELLGDTFLKLASSAFVFSRSSFADEGELTEERSKLVRNSYLSRLGKTSGLADCLISNAFSSATTKRREVFSSEATTKPDADVVEAIVGAALRDKGYDEALVVLADVGLDLRLDDLADSPLPIPPGRAPTLSLFQHVIAYTFSDVGLLQRALVHGSVVSNSYQRLEFLGDAVLDFLVTQRLMDQTRYYFSQGEYSAARSLIVNNESLTAIALGSLRLVEFVQHNLKGASQVSRLSDCLSDILEAVIGAVYVDCAQNLSLVWNVFSPFFADAIHHACAKLEMGAFKEVDNFI